MKSIIYANELLKNKDKKRAAKISYYPAQFHSPDGKHSLLLFTANEIKVAERRAKKNPEDFKGVKFVNKPWWKIW